MTNTSHRDAALAKLASSWAHLSKTTKGATSQKRNPDGSFVSQTSEWSQAWKDYQAGLAELGLITDPAPAPTPQTESTLASFRTCTDCAAKAGDLSYCDYVICHQWEYAFDALPNTKVLAYRNASFASPSGGLTQAAMKPEWYASIGGVPATSAYYSNQFFADVGHSGYQQAWLDKVLADCSTFDGIFLDDVNMDQDWHLTVKLPDGSPYLRVFDKYPTRSSWLAAMDSFIAFVGPKLKAAGKLALPNIYVRDFWSNFYKGVHRDWAKDCSGAVREHYTKWGEGTDGQHLGDGFDHFQDIYRETQAVGIFIGQFSAPKSDVRSQTYARAAFLLEWIPGSGAALAFSPSPEAQPPWTDVWTADLGLPKGAKGTYVNGHDRHFDKGYVALDKINGTAQIVRTG